MNVLRRIRRLWARIAAWPHRPETSEASTWCLVGNVVDEHPFGESGEVRSGSKQFVPGTKVYCLPPQWGDGYEKAIVVGIARGSRRWITVVMSTSLIANWRAKVVYKPAVLKRLREGFDGFNSQWTSRSQVERWTGQLRNRNALAARNSP